MKTISNVAGRPTATETGPLTAQGDRLARGGRRRRRPGRRIAGDRDPDRRPVLPLRRAGDLDRQVQHALGPRRQRGQQPDRPARLDLRHRLGADDARLRRQEVLDPHELSLRRPLVADDKLVHDRLARSRRRRAASTVTCGVCTPSIVAAGSNPFASGGNSFDAVCVVVGEATGCWTGGVANVGGVGATRAGPRGSGGLTGACTGDLISSGGGSTRMNDFVRSDSGGGTSGAVAFGVSRAGSGSTGGGLRVTVRPGVSLDGGTAAAGGWTGFNPVGTGTGTIGGTGMRGAGSATGPSPDRAWWARLDGREPPEMSPSAASGPGWVAAACPAPSRRAGRAYRREARAPG